METYKVKVAIPSKINGWEANVVEKVVEVESFNHMLMKALSPEEVRAGARIIRIERERYYEYRQSWGWEIIKNC